MACSSWSNFNDSNRGSESWHWPVCAEPRARCRPRTFVLAQARAGFRALACRFCLLSLGSWHRIRAPKNLNTRSSLEETRQLAAPCVLVPNPQHVSSGPKDFDSAGSEVGGGARGVRKVRSGCWASLRYEGPNNTMYLPGNTHDRLTADPPAP